MNLVSKKLQDIELVFLYLRYVLNSLMQKINHITHVGIQLKNAIKGFLFFICGVKIN